MAEWVESLDKTPHISEYGSDEPLHIGDETEIDEYTITTEYFDDGYSVGIRTEDGIVVVAGTEL